MSRSDNERETQEFTWPQVGWADPRYFNSSSFRKKWIDRRTGLMDAWTFPVLILQGELDPRQPPLFYDQVEHWLRDGRAQFVDAGQFLILENPTAVTQAIEDFLRAIA